jgi:alkylated DNA repair dioxygenase AlkB
MLAVGEHVRRVWLDRTSWVDVLPGWQPEASAWYDRLAADASWRQGRMWRYDRWVVEPRLTAPTTGDGRPLFEYLVAARRDLVHRYRVPFDQGALSWYRDGRDSVAFHRDREMRWLDDTVVAILTLGGPRRFVIKPLRGSDEPVLDLAPGSGDLVVLGGRCQADWLHAVPKEWSIATPGRMSVQWRWTSRRGRPDRSPSYRAPRNFGDRASGAY